MPYLLKIRSYGEDTGTLSDLKEKIYSRYGRRYEDTPYGRRYAYGRCPIGRSKEKRYGRRYEDTVEDTKIQSKIPRYGEDTVISQDLLMFRVLHT